MRIHIPKIIVISILLSGLISCSKAPSDSELISTFKSHKRAFIELQKLALENPKITTVSQDPITWKKAKGKKLSNADVKKYVKLLKLINVNQKLAGIYDFGQISLIAYDAPGITGSAYLKGFVFTPYDKSLVVENLDDWTPDPKKPDQYAAIRNLSGGWYLFVIKQ